jgi:hypothetical protein
VHQTAFYAHEVKAAAAERGSVRVVRASFPITGPNVRVTPRDGSYLVRDTAGINYSFIESTVATSTVVEAKTPVWAIVLAVVIFPMGLLFLFAKEYKPCQAPVMTLRAANGAWLQVRLAEPRTEVTATTYTGSGVNFRSEVGLR